MEKSISVSILLLLLSLSGSHSLRSSVVVTNQGLILGSINHVISGDVHSFLGIPYAQPPRDNLRFEAPLPYTQSWSGLYNATNYKSSCPQSVSNSNCQGYQKNISDKLLLSEDCLYLNIFTPIPNIAGNNSVLVWFHHGDFTCGSGSWWDPSVLVVTEETVVVTVNYRLGALGLLTSSGQQHNTNDEISPNLALRDQQLALQWIKDNIVRFGGRSADIAIVGNSAGAIWVGLHTVIPSSESLFTSAILQSGTPTSPYATKTKSQAQDVFQQFVTAANCSQPTFNLTLQCLQYLPINTVLQIQQTIIISTPNAFTPIIDGQLIPNDPKILLSTGQFNKVRVMIGTNLNDGTNFLNILANISSGLTRDSFKARINVDFPSYNNASRSAIIYKYTDWSNSHSPLSNRAEYEKIFNDFYYARPAIEAAGLYARYVSTYTYVFAYRTQHDDYFPSYDGVAHTMEIPYVFGYPLLASNHLEINYTEPESRLSKHLMSLWGSFADEGVPVSRVSTVSWQLYTTDSSLYYYINNANSETRSHYIADRIEFWNTFIPQINVPSYPGIATSTSFPSTPSSTHSFTNNTTSPLTSQLPTTSLGSTAEVTTLAQACADIQTIQQIYLISTFSLSGLVGLLIIAIIVIIIKTKKRKTDTT